MRAKEFLNSVEEHQINEALPALGTAVSGLGRAALAGGSAIARGGAAALRGIGDVARTVGQQALSTAGTAIGQQIANRMVPQQPTMPKPGQMYNHPRFGPVKVLPLAAGERGLKLDTTKALGHFIVIPPEQLNI